jgi:hypothetical protein
MKRVRQASPPAESACPSPRLLPAMPLIIGLGFSLGCRPSRPSSPATPRMVGVGVGVRLMSDRCVPNNTRGVPNHNRGVPSQNLSRSIQGFSRTSPRGLPLDSRTPVYWRTSVSLFDSRTPLPPPPSCMMHCSYRCLLQRSLLREHILYSKRTHSRVT